MTLEEVLKGILQPLALRIVQRSGKVYVYDLNGLYSKGKQTAIVWDGASQTMGVDVVYNNAKLRGAHTRKAETFCRQRAGLCRLISSL